MKSQDAWKVGVGCQAGWFCLALLALVFGPTGWAPFFAGFIYGVSVSTAGFVGKYAMFAGVGSKKYVAVRILGIVSSGALLLGSIVYLALAPLEAMLGFLSGFSAFVVTSVVVALKSEIQQSGGRIR